VGLLGLQPVVDTAPLSKEGMSDDYNPPLHRGCPPPAAMRTAA